MPLSEHEQRLLEQMERALYAEDPKLASALRGADPRTHVRRRLVIAAVGFVAGLALVMTGVARSTTWLSVVGFVIMVAAAFVAASSWRGVPTREGRVSGGGGGLGQSPSRSPRPRATGGGFMSRLEERWNRRREQNGGR